MSHLKIKTKYNTEGNWGSTEERTLYADYNNCCDVVTFYDDNGDFLFTSCDTIDNNLCDAIHRLETTNPDDNKDVEHMTPEDDIKCHKGSYLPGTNIFAPYIPLQITRTERNPEYDKFMKEYNKQHEVCPKCGATEHTSTLMGYILNMDKKEEYKNKNACTCVNCCYKHIVHDRISVYDFKRKEFCCKYPIVIANYDPSIDYVFHIKNGDYDPIISSIAVSNTIKLYDESFPGVTHLKYENLERDWYELLELSKLWRLK